MHFSQFLNFSNIRVKGVAEDMMWSLFSEMEEFEEMQWKKSCTTLVETCWNLMSNGINGINHLSTGGFLPPTALKSCANSAGESSTDQLQLFQVSGDSAQKKSPQTQRVFEKWIHLGIVSWSEPLLGVEGKMMNTGNSGNIGNPWDGARYFSSQSSLQLLPNHIESKVNRSVLGSFQLRSGILRWGSNLAGAVRGAVGDLKLRQL